MNIIETSKTILTRMLNKISSVYDKSEGSFFYDLLSPVSIELNKLKVKVAELFSNCFADTATGKDLERICKTVGIYRKTASASTGYVTVKGSYGAKIVEGEIVSCGLINFAFMENATIPEIGEIKVKVQCKQVGLIGNVPAGSIINFPKTLEGLTSVINDEDFINGYETENDEELRERYYLRVRMPSTSGNRFHYEAWSRDVIGVSDSKCIPRWNGRGTVKVVIVDSNHHGANKELVKEVFNYIETQRPIGADVTVVGAEDLPINIDVTIALNSSYILNDVVKNIKSEITKYLQDNGFRCEYISIAKISQIILGVDGVNDLKYETLKLNGQSKNVVLEIDQIATLGNLNVGV